MSKKRATLWKCPHCGRGFAKANQWHSCQRRPLDQHFAGKDKRLREIFDLLISRLRKCGPLRVDAVESSINLASKHHFGGIAVRRDYLRLGLAVDAKLDNERIVRRQQLGRRRVGHTVILRSAADRDRELMTWLKRAYQLQSR